MAVIVNNSCRHSCCCGNSGLEPATVTWLSEAQITVPDATDLVSGTDFTSFLTDLPVGTQIRWIADDGITVMGTIVVDASGNLDITTVGQITMNGQIIGGTI